jgi:hypothetical protein
MKLKHQKKIFRTKLIGEKWVKKRKKEKEKKKTRKKVEMPGFDPGAF